jgi:predicted hydrolase (HD superfamily)
MMNAPLVERRKTLDLNSALAPSRSDVIRKSLLVREEIGTMSAFEYLKSHAVHRSVIQRVLAEGAIRAEDRAVMQTTQALQTG